MSRKPLSVIPVEAPVMQDKFDLYTTMIAALATADQTLQDGDVVALSSKYAAISEGRVVDLDDVIVSDEAARIADRYVMNPQLTELILREADHIFGGIVHEFNDVQIGFLLTNKEGIISPNAGLDRSNIPNGKVVLFPRYPYQFAAAVRHEIAARLGVNIGVVLTDSWLMPGRMGTTGVALATAGFEPVKDMRGKADLFGNPMQVTQVGVADTIAICAQMVMGEVDEATPIAIVRNSNVELIDIELSKDAVAIDWEMDIYVGALTVGLLEGGAPTDTPTQRHMRRELPHDIQGA